MAGCWFGTECFLDVLGQQSGVGQFQFTKTFARHLSKVAGSWIGNVGNGCMQQCHVMLKE